MAPPRDGNEGAVDVGKAGARPAVPERSIEELDDEIATLAAQIHAATYRMLVLLAEFDEREGWFDGGVGDSPGFRSCAHWLHWRTGIDLGAAREKVRTARALRELPEIGASMERGEISFSKVRALTRVATAENEAELLELARCATAAQVERLVSAWRRADRSEEISETQARHEGRKLAAFFDDDGMLVIRGRLEPEVGALVLRAIEAAEDEAFREERGDGDPAESAESDDLPPSPEQRRADALGRVAEAALGGGLEATPTSADRYQVVVHTTRDVLADAEAVGPSALDDGVRVSAETSQRVACDCSKVEVTVGEDGSVLDIGRRTRVVSTPLRRALRLRDRSCRFPGCTSRFCDAHHVRHWAAGGETKLGNLVLLCRRHHRAVHEGGFSVEVTAEGELVFRRPDGRRLRACGERAVGARGRRIAWLDHGAKSIDARTCAQVGWGGELDVGYVLDSLRE